MWLPRSGTTPAPRPKRRPREPSPTRPPVAPWPIRLPFGIRRSFRLFGRRRRSPSSHCAARGLQHEPDHDHAMIATSGRYGREKAILEGPRMPQPVEKSGVAVDEDASPGFHAWICQDLDRLRAAPRRAPDLTGGAREVFQQAGLLSGGRERTRGLQVSGRLQPAGAPPRRPPVGSRRAKPAVMDPPGEQPGDENLTRPVRSCSLVVT